MFSKTLFFVNAIILVIVVALTTTSSFTFALKNSVCSNLILQENNKQQQKEEEFISDCDCNLISTQMIPPSSSLSSSSSSTLNLEEQTFLYSCQEKQREAKTLSSPSAAFNNIDNNNSNQCSNLGIFNNNTNRCDCQFPNWNGSTCMERVCVTSLINKNTQHPHYTSELPDPGTDLCSCNNGYKGISCQQCTSDSQCSTDQFCDKNLLSIAPDAVAGSGEFASTNMQCKVADPHFNNLLGDGDLGIATYNCRLPLLSSDSNSNNNDHQETDKSGDCAVSFFREREVSEDSQEEKLLDNFFHCELSQCGVEKITVLRQMPSATETTKHMYGVARIVVMLLLVIFILIGFVKNVPSRSAYVAMSAMASFGILGIMFLIIWTVSSTEDRDFVVHEMKFDCDTSVCTCFENPGRSDVSDSCSNSNFGKYIIPNLKSGAWIKCPISSPSSNGGGSIFPSACTFLQKDLNSEVALSCDSAYCQQRHASTTSSTPSPGDLINHTTVTATPVKGVSFFSLVKEKVTSTVVLVVGGFVLLFLFLFYAYRQQVRGYEASREFAETFLSLDENQQEEDLIVEHHHQQQEEEGGGGRKNIEQKTKKTQQKTNHSAMNEIFDGSHQNNNNNNSSNNSVATMDADSDDLDSRNSPTTSSSAAAAVSSSSKKRRNDNENKQSSTGKVKQRQSKRWLNAETVSISTVNFCYSVYNSAQTFEQQARQEQKHHQAQQQNSENVSSSNSNSNANNNNENEPTTSTSSSNENTNINNDSQHNNNNGNGNGNGNNSEVLPVLRNVTLNLQGGQAIALCGPSGSAKTSLLEALSAQLPVVDYFTPATLSNTSSTNLQTATPPGPGMSGAVLVDGRQIFPNPDYDATIATEHSSFCAVSSIVAQNDILIPSLTVRQAIYYSGRLQLPSILDRQQIESLTQVVIDLLHLNDVADKLIGTATGNDSNFRGLSGGERRRLSIATNLIGLPRIIFLDEPTSSLSSVDAFHIIQTLVDIATGRSKLHSHPSLGRFANYRPLVIFSVHQPSEALFNMFDALILMQKGRVVFAGAAQSALPFLLEYVRSELMSSSVHLSTPERILSVCEFSEVELDAAVSATHSATVSSLNAARSNNTFSSPSTWIHDDDENTPPAAVSSSSSTSTNLRSSLRPIQEQQQHHDHHHQEEEYAPVSKITKASQNRAHYAMHVPGQIGYVTMRGALALVCQYNILFAHAAATLFIGSILAAVYESEPLSLQGALNRAGSITFMLLVTAFLSLSAIDWSVNERRLLRFERRNHCYGTAQYLTSKIFLDLIPLRIVPAAMLSILVYEPLGLRCDSGGYFIWFTIIQVLFAIQTAAMTWCAAALTSSFGAAALLSSIVILWNFVFCGLLVQAGTLPALFVPFRSVSPFFLAFEALMVNELDGQTCTFSPEDASGNKGTTVIPLYCRQYLFNLGLKPDRFVGDVLALCFWCGFFIVLAGFCLHGIPEFVEVAFSKVKNKFKEWCWCCCRRFAVGGGGSREERNTLLANNNSPAGAGAGVEVIQQNDEEHEALFTNVE